MGFSWRKTFKIKQTRKSKCLSALIDVEHAQCLTGYHVFMVSGLDLARAPRRARLTARKKGSGYENESNLVPRACDPWEGNEGSGIIRCRKPGILAKIELRIHFNGQSDSSLKRIIPEPSFPSKGSQARGTRLEWIHSRPQSHFHSVTRWKLGSGLHDQMERSDWLLREPANYHAH